MSVILSVAALNAHAFKSISIQFPDGVPEMVQYEVSYSTGDCVLNSPKHNCTHSGSSMTLPGYLIANIIQNFSNEHRNEVFKKDPTVNQNNYMKLSIPGRSGVCTVNLKMKRDIVISLDYIGNCTI